MGGFVWTDRDDSREWRIWLSSLRRNHSDLDRFGPAVSPCVRRERKRPKDRHRRSRAIALLRHCEAIKRPRPCSKVKGKTAISVIGGMELLSYIESEPAGPTVGPDCTHTAPVTVLQAPFGYGKTTLLARVARDHLATGGRVIALMADTAGVVLVDRGQGADRRERLTFADLTERLSQLLTGSPGACVLADNWDYAPSEILRGMIEMFLDPEQLRPGGQTLWLATRAPLDLPLARARATGLMRDLDASTLSLAANDLRGAIETATQTPVNSQRLAEVMDVTEGWPLAVRRLLDQLAKHGLNGAMRRMSAGSPFFSELFEQEFGANLPIGLNQDILALACVPVFDASAAAEICGVVDFNGFVAANHSVGLPLFAEPLAPGWYRYHRLFRDHVRAASGRADPARHQRDALKATEWFNRHGMYEAAFDCAVQTASWRDAAEILDGFCQDAYTSGRGRHVTMMALKLPREILSQYPRVLAVAACCAASWWRYGLAEKLLEVSGADMAPAGPPENEAAALLLHAGMLAAQFEDRQKVVERACLDLADRLDLLPPYTRGTVHGSLLYAQREQFNFSGVSKLETAATKEFKRSEKALGMIWHASVMGPTRAMMGNVDGALRCLDEAYALAVRAAETEWLVSAPAAHLAELHYERNDTARAEQLLANHFPLDAIGFIDQHIAAYVTSARLHLLGKRPEEALRRLDDALLLAERHAMDRLRVAAIAEKLRCLIALARIEDALLLGRNELGHNPERRPMPQPGCTTGDELKAQSWVRLETAGGQTDQALDVASAWSRFLEKAGCLRNLVYWDILRAQLYASRCDDALAQRALRRALTIAAPRRMLRPFLDAGGVMDDLLARQQQAAPIATGAADAFVCELLELRGAPQGSSGPEGEAEDDQPEADPLSPRQVEILQMASAGLLNREIGGRMGLSEASVKWHLQQIYDRIGIRRRAGAFERALHMGLVVRMP